MPRLSCPATEVDFQDALRQTTCLSRLKSKKNLHILQSYLSDTVRKGEEVPRKTSLIHQVGERYGETGEKKIRIY